MATVMTEADYVKLGDSYNYREWGIPLKPFVEGTRDEQILEKHPEKEEYETTPLHLAVGKGCSHSVKKEISTVGKIDDSEGTPKPQFEYEYPPPIATTKPQNKLSRLERYERSDNDLLHSLFASLGGRVSIDTIKDGIPKIRKYLKQIYESDGFDIDEMPGISWYSSALAKCVCCRKCRPEDYDKYMNLAQYAIDETYNKDNKEFKVLRVNSVNATIARAEAFHLTFTAQDVGKAGDIPACKRTFQAVVLTWYTYGNKEEKFKLVEKCRLKF